MARQELLSSLGLLGIVATCSGVAIQSDEAVAAPVARPASASSGLAEPASCARKGPTHGTPLSSSGQGGTVALASWGKQVVAYVLHEDDRAIHAIDVDSGKQLGVTTLNGAPASLLVLGDGRVAVTLRDENKLQLLEPGAAPGDSFAVRCSLDVPSEPFGLATSPDGATLAVTSAWAHKVLAFDVATMKVRAEVDVPREPRAVVVDDDGERAFVAHVVDAKMSVVDLPTASSALPSVRTIDLRAKKSGQLQAGCQGFALAKAVTTLPAHAGQPGSPAASEKPALRGSAPPGEPVEASRPSRPRAPKAPTVPDHAIPQVEARIFAPMVVVDPGEVEQASSGGYGSPERGPTERPLVSVVDAGAERPMTRTAAGDALVSSDACLLPRAAAFDAGSQSLLVVCLGSNAVLRLDGRAVDPSRRQLASFRVPAGPTGIALDEQRGRAVVFSQFASALTVVSIADGKTREISVPAILSRMPAAQLLRGRALFHATNDGRISGDGRACASCHPDGRDDAITWQTPDGPRQTIMLAGRLSGSAPFGWDGDKSTVRAHVTDTLARLRGTGMAVLSADRADFEDLLAYVGSMKAPKVTPDAARAALVARGEELFQDETTSCAGCHPAGRTNGKAVVVSMGATKIDTPSLTGVAGTAPYFHDGRFATLEDLLKSPDHFMGKTVQLTRKDRVALAAFLETL